MILIIESRSK